MTNIILLLVPLLLPVLAAAPDVAFPARHGGDVGLHGASPSAFAI